MYNLRKKNKVGSRLSGEEYDELNDDVSFATRKRKAEVLSTNTLQEADDESSCSSDSTKADSNNGGDELMHDIEDNDVESLVKRRKLHSGSPSPLSAADWVVVATLVDNEHEPAVSAGPVVPTAEDVSRIQILEQENARMHRELLAERELRAKLLASLYVRTQEILVEENSYDLLDKQIKMLTSTSMKLQKENLELHQSVTTLKAEADELRKRSPNTLSGHVMSTEAQLELEKHKKALEVAIVYQQHQAMLAYAAQQQAQQWLLQQQLANTSEAPTPSTSSVPGYHPSFVAAMQQMQAQSKQTSAQAAN